MHDRNKKHLTNSAIKCLAGAQYALTVDNKLDQAILWSVIALVHLRNLDEESIHLDSIIRTIEESRNNR
jgi:hypothetical protein